MVDSRRQARPTLALRAALLLIFAGVLLASIFVLNVSGQQVSRPSPPTNNSGNGAKDIATQIDELQRAVASLQQQIGAMQGTLATVNQRLQTVVTSEANLSTLVSNQTAGINQNIAQSQSQIQAQMLDVQRRVATICLILVEVNAPQHVRVCPQ